ncbi:inositol 2-dehydrogenase [Dictyobacter kobayashii]|uniref:Inositol 2-dehydrogenase n=1 Tax=Dictyobacter kobayashii TaxID=2014872 RepID=A0A402AS22_9CHLR|nr:inositol 2-dehydrogenase [Dictyobacter kobayashii]GCE21897.1 inositol 2-dehydrogenase [Dictyobacter kobayashii]
MPANRLKIGLIGAGRIGSLHAEHLVTRIPAAHLLMVADTNEEAARACAERYTIPSFTCNYMELLEHPAIQAVVICSSTATHACIIEEAAQLGKHIFCEKPIALDLPTIDRAIAAVERASSGRNLKLQIGFNRRFDANYRRVRQAVERAEVGRPHLLHITSRDPTPPPIEYIRASGGLFLDMMIHDFDMARFLIGSEVEEVFTLAGVMSDPAIGEAGDVDTAVVMLRFANGVIATINNSRRAAYGYDQRVELLGSAGAISTDNNYPNTAIISDGRCVRRDLPLHFFLERYTESFVRELSAFVEAVHYDQPVPVSAQDGRAPVVMALAAHRSLQEQRPVRLSEIDAIYSQP